VWIGENDSDGFEWRERREMLQQIFNVSSQFVSFSDSKWRHIEAIRVIVAIALPVSGETVENEILKSKK
jgi:hypothetical protein